MAEVLAPVRLDITAEFRRGFAGLTETPASLDELLQAREDLIAAIVGRIFHAPGSAILLGSC